jgi:hypothetical protein
MIASYPVFKPLTYRIFRTAMTTFGDSYFWTAATVMIPHLEVSCADLELMEQVGCGANRR